MRAKDYVFLYLQEPTDETLARIVADMILEIPTIVRKRQVSPDASFLKVVKDQDQKWQIFARRVEGVSEDGFRNIVAERYPDLFRAAWPDLSISEDN